MLRVPQQTLDKIKKVLLKQQKSVEERLKGIEKDDPLLAVDVVEESSESGTESWQAEVHNRLQTVKKDLSEFSKKIKNSLLRIHQGTYGECDRCGNPIEEERLAAMPTASLCITCSKKSPKR